MDGPVLDWPDGISSLSLADLTDVNLVLGGLDPTLFPNISSSIQVHDGFADEQAK
jgi:hypothetical protein